MPAAPFDIHNSGAEVTVWGQIGGKPLHDGMAVEYTVTIANGKPQSYQRTLYEDGKVLTTDSSTDVSDVPDYIRAEVEKHMVPRGTWE
jgi:hypothetical protein